MGSWSRLTGMVAVLLALFVQGCGGISPFDDTPLKQAKRAARAPLQSVTQAKVPGGTLTFYRYVRETECGSGWVFDINGVTSRGAESGGPCNFRETLGISCGAGAGGSKPFGVCYGEVNDPRIVSVRVFFQGKEQGDQATVVNGFWYIFLPGQRVSPVITRADGLDDQGRLVAQYNPGQP